jgi:predicted DCC family thiol-disulfide oxidoreductase YuxK
MDATVPSAADLIVFDGKCIFCSGFARFMARRDVERRFHFVTAHSALGRSLYLAHGLDPDLMATNIVIIGGRAHVKMGAFAAAIGTVGWPWRALAVLGLLPRWVGDPVYDWIARNRYRFGRQVCVMPSGELKARLIE